MYTLKVTKGYRPDFKRAFQTALKDQLALHNLSCDRVSTFLDRVDVFSVSGFKMSGEMLKKQDWFNVNDCINAALDVLNVSADVRCERYYIRSNSSRLVKYNRKGERVR